MRIETYRTKIISALEQFNVLVKGKRSLVLWGGIQNENKNLNIYVYTWTIKKKKSKIVNAELSN